MHNSFDKATTFKIQKNISNAAAQEVISTIIIDEDYVSIDKSHDVSIKERMAIVVRYHVKSKWISYDRASNMRVDFNGLKTLMLKNNNLAFYVHYFSHQLVLTLVIIVKHHMMKWFTFLID
uniref:Uncharacterized protein n=1 Tax=Kalanchoe fedtschenkoi TaxID=63787 RepID=A0A7N0T0M7_KALFE